MPLTKLIRWLYKLEPTQVLKVGFNVPGTLGWWEFFYAKMEKSGKIFIPKIAQSYWIREGKSLAGLIVEVTLDPVQNSKVNQ